MSTQLILALDVPTREEARPLLTQLQGSLPWVKVGLQMFTAYGPDWVREVADLGFKVFLDLKLHDIPNTVAKSVESLSALPIGMLTLHTAGGRAMMAAAQQAQAQIKPDLQLLGVTVLTSMDATSLDEIGCGSNAATQVSRLAHLGIDAGLSGFVCSPLEVGMLRQALPANTQLVTPGMRPAGADIGDQSRIMTPSYAARAGSTHIVVGRSILKAPYPAAAAQAIMAELKI
ncbi:MAG: orotidine-5'-phosphate decarboxylase [Candidatus Synoicihabitans palmerolidicus]|nr:orotidine-5'-phosphate decarboxylase [Candidatus Synoicihabitans palmerolidicus]